MEHCMPKNVLHQKDGIELNTDETDGNEVPYVADNLADLSNRVKKRCITLFNSKSNYYN